MELLLLIIVIVIFYWIIKFIKSNRSIDSSKIDDCKEKTEVREEPKKSTITKVKTLQQQIMDKVQDKPTEDDFKYTIIPEESKSDILSELKEKGISNTLKRNHPKNANKSGLENPEFTYKINDETGDNSILKDFINNNGFKIRSKLTINDIAKIKNLKATEFEDFIAQVYSKLGYIVSITPQSCDGGVDIIAKKEGVKTLYIQCKGWKGNVGVTIVREMAGVVSNKINSKALIITTSDFTDDAKKEGSSLNVELIDFTKLMEIIDIANKD